ncbi:hypothetical protein PR202_ga10670 [Eleusine coracana subsp. coracana]|uniref:Uncharacterized protein n=1 Tax=Eleusine coracana subsp. coracana TaxID=191504 RepID=A0AAV5C788_ELECO|nr:hypothetical protein PR202_ga10670 [Eleusine coracana subsp. coracana]
MAPGLYSDIGKKTRGPHHRLSLPLSLFSLCTYLPFVSSFGDRYPLDPDAVVPGYAQICCTRTTTRTRSSRSPHAPPTASRRECSAITAAGTRKNESIFGELQTQIKNKNLTVDVKANSESDPVPLRGLKSILSLVVPDQRSGKLELQYLHEYAGLNASIGLNSNPMVNLSGVFGSNELSVGVDVSFDTATSNFTKYNAALSVTNPDLIASLHLGLVQHEWRPKSFVTLSGEVDTKAIEKSTKFGLSLVLKH